MITRTRIIGAFVLIVAGLLTFLKVPVASSQGITLLAGFVSEDLPTTDPSSELWDQATKVEIPLSAQTVAKPFLAESTIRSVSARALHDGSEVAFLVEWSDDTLSDQTLRTEDFRDAVAVQFPLVEGQPFFCMGQPGGEVNIWHWKADWQADLLARQDMETVYPDMQVNFYPFANPAAGVLAGPADYDDLNYLPALASGNLLASATHASPVEDSIAGGFGGLTSQPATGQNVDGAGEWVDGNWRVVFSRELVSNEPVDASFTPGTVYPMAFAVWDGENEERNGRKSTSQWISLQLEEEAEAPVTAPEAPAPVPPSAGISEPIIFAVIPVAATAILIGMVAGGFYLLASLLQRRK
jgi:hypothetical protein